MKRLMLIAGAAAVVGIWPAASSAAPSTSVVVAKQRGALLVASPAGIVRAVSGSAAIGSRVVMSGGHARVVGRSSTARIRGVVVRRAGATTFVSSNRHLVAVAGSAPTSQPGDVVSSQVAIRNGELDEIEADEVGHIDANVLQVQAVVAAVGPGTVTLTVGAQSLTLALPNGLTLPASVVGQTVTFTVSLDDRNAADDEGEDHHGHGDGGGGSDG